MTKRFDVFLEMPCLTEQSVQLNGLALQKKWFRSADKRILGQYFQKFVAYNSTLFSFLGVQPFICGTDQKTTLAFRSSHFIGTIPLRASDTGKQIGDFVVTPRFTGSNRFEDYIEILDLLGTEVSPQVVDSLSLSSGANFRPPMYLEAVKFVLSLEQLTRIHWRKFDSIERVESHPTGQVNWNKYIQSEAKVEHRLRFPTRKNILCEFHREYAELRYVFDICKTELLSSNTPLRIKNALRARLFFLEDRLYMHKPLEASLIAIKPSDHPVVKKCKVLANNILRYKFVDSTAWRVDFSDVFEKFIQHIFRATSRETGGRLVSNFKFHSRPSNAFSWSLKHLEPDAIYQKDNLLVFIDAKYKSNLYNKFHISDKLKEDHRYDVHQVLAYCSFSSTALKHGFLCYPSNRLEFERITYKNGINGVTNTILVLGIPLNREVINGAKKLLTAVLHEIEKGCSGLTSTQASR